MAAGAARVPQKPDSWMQPASEATAEQQEEQGVAVVTIETIACEECWEQLQLSPGGGMLCQLPWV